MPKRIDVTGQRFGRLVATRYAGSINGRTVFECQCDCGKVVIVETESLRSGHTKSCGCYAREMLSKRSTTHGGSGTKLFRVWITMKDRCNNPNCKKYKRYGGRGIKVCDEWMESFQSFKEWSLNNGYKEGLSIDRIDNDGNYCPENCRWATPTEQGNNTSTNVRITYNGETHTATEWARILNVRPSAITRRKMRGWTDEDCIEVPVIPHSSKFAREKYRKSKELL